MAPDGVCEGLQQGCRLADPVSQGRAIEIEAFPAEDLALAEKRQVIGIFAVQNMGQETRAGAATVDGT